LIAHALLIRQMKAIAARAITIRTIPEKTKSVANVMATRDEGFISKSISELSNIRNTPNIVRAKAMSSIIQGPFLLSNH
jgi:RNA-splicing ligase RtcB